MYIWIDIIIIIGNVSHGEHAARGLAAAGAGQLVQLHYAGQHLLLVPVCVDSIDK